MDFPLLLGLVVAAIGGAGLALAWLHPSPTSLPLVKALAWPRKSRDRMDVALSGLLLLAIGALFIAGSAGGSAIVLLVSATVLLAAGIAIGVR